MTERRHKRRLFTLAIIVIACFFALGTKIVLLHSGFRAGNMERILSLRRLERSIEPERGRIFDRSGNLLAFDVARKEIWADPSIVVSNNAVEQIASVLSDHMDIEPDFVSSRLNDPRRRFVYPCGYGTTVDLELADTIQRRELPGLFLNNVFVRSYPRGSSMGHVLGHVNLERQGSAGIEQSFDERMRGVRGLLVGERDGRRREVYDRRSLEIMPHRGSDVQLTLDQFVQFITERALESAVAEHDALAAWAVVMRIKTGEILAMASVPAYDPNEFRNVDPEHMRNRCIAQIYEPGSTFKIAVVAAALDAGVVTARQIFHCEHGVWMYERRPLRDYSPHGELSVADVIKKSSNIGAAKIALLLGDNRLYDYLKAFGIGGLTGISLPGEEAGILRPVNRWTSLSPTRIAIGHEVATTALQMLNALCAIANGGILMKPRVVRRIMSFDGSVLFEGRPVVLGRPIRPDTAELMKALLIRTTEEGGTGHRARLAGYTVGGKTGTSQKVIDGVYADRLNIASFAGFLPAENPELGIIVVVDEPKRSVRTGGTVAAPVFRDIAEQAVRYLDIPPSPITGINK